MIPKSIKLKIGFHGLSVVKFHPEIEHLIVSTQDGRIRIYDCSVVNPVELFRKKWHKNILSLDITKSGSTILTSSSAGCIKLHDYESEKETWSNLEAHNCPVTALSSQNDHLFVSGDSNGLVKFWDIRQTNNIDEIDLKDNEYLNSINTFAFDEARKSLFVAVDDGNLCTINCRKKKKLEVRSENMGSSCRGVTPIKDQSKLLVATENMSFSFFNWNQFGHFSDRFPLTKDSTLELESVVKINENLVAVSTNQGRIMACSIFPNRVLVDIGHFDADEEEGCASDCMSLSVNCSEDILAACVPDCNVVKFYSLNVAIKQTEEEMTDRIKNKRKKKEKEQINSKILNKKQRLDEFLADMNNDDADLKCSDDDDDSNCSDDDDDSNCSDDDDDSKCSDDDDDSKCSDVEDDSKCSDDEDDSKCSDDEDDSKCSDDEDDNTSVSTIKEEEYDDDTKKQINEDIDDVNLSDYDCEYLKSE